jgi:hypothetical protein
MRFHTTLKRRIDPDQVTEVGWNVAITLTLLGLSREEPAFARLAPAPACKFLSTEFRSASSTALAVFDSRLLATCQEWCEQPNVGELVDQFIIWQAGNFGYPITLSEFVRVRTMVWWATPAQPDKQRHLIKAFAQAIESVYHKKGESRPPLTDPALYAGRREMIEDLDYLFRRVGSVLGSRRLPANRSEVIEEIVKIAGENRRERLNVHRNIGSIVKYLETETKEYSEMLGKGNAVSAAQFFDDWFAFHSGYKPSTIRRKLTELGPGR